MKQLVAEAETQGVIVRATPLFLDDQSDVKKARFVWAYTIEIENTGNESVQLLNRRWKIVDGHGVTREVRGAGVVGEQPVIAPGGTYSYTSGAELSSAAGLMSGGYEMRVLSNGAVFEAEIPAFPLDSPFGPKHAN